ncbi:mitochondrial grpe [Crepidotus variabilis]|uniref:GrpE protein homolog, mitochondrial n=1 Tax=Crepidotus variabilis TaxID=179855 RepID=A0A9P6EQ94_9AGAR|nr:mitochondrial grpe [Crepidotus variabilis]
MSLAASSFKAFRSCTAALSAPRTLARPVAGRCSTRLSRTGARCYSEQKVSEDKSKDDSATSKEGEADPSTELKAKLKAKEDEVVDLTSRLRYLQADFLNLQRNSAREKEQTKDFAISRFAGDLLETVDVLSIAIKSVPIAALKPATHSGASDATPPLPEIPAEALPKSHEAYLNDLHTGVEMTQRLLLSTLFKYHVKPFDPTGDKFDPNLHEALYQAPIPGKEPGTVLECQKIGYKIKDRVLRAAQVGVVQDLS